MSFTILQGVSKDLIQSSSGSLASSTIANFIKRELNSGVHTVQAALRSYINQDVPQTASTAASQQYYHYPPGVYPPIEAATMTVSSIAYPLEVVHSQARWDQLNMSAYSGTTRPLYIFPRRDDFGLYPIPGGVYTVSLTSSFLAVDMTASDYTTGTVTATNDSTTLTGAGTTWTAAMAGRWFALTDSSGNPASNWYRLHTFSSTTQMVLESVWEAATAAAQTYIIGETPEIPPELHELLPHYVAYKFYAGPRKDPSAAKMHKNIFDYGDPAPNYDVIRKPIAGLQGALVRYKSRDNSALVRRGSEGVNQFDERWTTTLS